MCTRREAAMIVEELSRGIAAGVSRHDISEKNWQIGDLAADLLLEHGIAVSPLVEGGEHFTRNLQVLPFCRRVEHEERGLASDITRVDLCPATKSVFNGGKNRLRQKGDSPWH